MNRLWLPLVLWAASPASGQTGATGLYTGFEHPPSVAVVKAIHAEVDNLLQATGLQIGWQTLPSNEELTWTELAVVTFAGSCEVLPFASNSHPDHRLGWTHISNGEVLPFATVDCDAVRAFILKDLMNRPSDSRDAVFGRAVARVTAHELMHIFAKTTHHGSSGVDQPTLSRDELMADHLDLESHETQSRIIISRANVATTPKSASAQDGKMSFLRQGCAVCHGADAQGTKKGPLLRGADKSVNSVILAAKLTKSQNKMYQRARNLKVTQPTLVSDELDDLACFLSESCR